MARTTQTRKRSRPSTWGRPMKRRRILRRRRGRANFASTQHGTVRPDYVPRMRMTRFKKRAYKRALYNYGQFTPRYHVSTSGTASLNTPATLTEYRFDAYECMNSLFDHTIYLNSLDGTAIPANVNGPIFLRGGECTLTLACEADEALDYKVQVVWLRKGGSVLASGTYSKGTWSLSSTSDKPNETTMVLKQWSGVLEKGAGVIKFHYKPKPRMYKNEWYSAANDEPYWYIYVGNSATAAAVGYTINRFYSVTVATHDK